MEEIRVKNLRCLSDTGYIDLRSITILVGQNSSGKSTFLRLFPLLRQSVESRSVGPLLWYGNLVDFGNFRDALYSKAERPEIVINFGVDIKRSRQSNLFLKPSFFPFGLDNKDYNLYIRVGLTVGYEERRDVSYTKKITLEIMNLQDHNKIDQIIDIDFDSDGKIVELLVNTRDLTQFNTSYHLYNRSSFLPKLSVKKFSKKMVESTTQFDSYLSATDIIEHLVNQISEWLPANTSKKTILGTISKIVIGDTTYMLSQLKLQAPTNGWIKLTENWTEDTEEFLLIRDLIIASRLDYLFDVLESYSTEFAKNIFYIAPVRATAERYYRVQNLAVDEVDFQGQNLTMVLKNLTDSEIKNFSEWTEKNFGVVVKTESSSGHISIKIQESGAENSYNLADTGFGFSQILPILTQLWMLVYLNKRKSAIIRKNDVLLAIEQPELHLHPHLQAKLVDALVISIKEAKENGITLKLLIETHSETFINRLGHSIMKGSISSSEVGVVLFNKTQYQTNTNIIVGKFDDDGYLENWPIGFFTPEY